MVNPFGRGKRQVGDNTTKRLAQSVKVPRPPTSADTHDPRTGKPFIKGTFWIVDQNPSSGAEGDLYYLKYNDVSAATWAAVLTGSGASSIDSLTTDSGTAIPDATGDVDILGGTNIATTATGDAVTINIDGTIGASNGGTGQSTYSEFDILIGNSSGGLDRSSQIDTAAQLPDGTDGDRPGTPSNGLIRYSTTNNCIEAYVNGAWVCLYDTGDTIPVEDGGTGATTLTGIITGNGTSPFTASTVTEGAVLLGGSSNLVNDTGVLAKGDLIVGDGVTDPVLLTVGTDGYVLTADSAEASGVKWAPNSAGPSSNNSTLELWDDMLYTLPSSPAGTEILGILGWRIAGTVTDTQKDGVLEAGHPGMVGISRASVGSSYIFTAQQIGGTDYAPILLGGGAVTVKFLVKIPTSSTGTERFKITVGLCGFTNFTAGSDPDNGCFFTLVDDENSAQWICHTSSGGTATSTNTSTTDDNDWHEYEIRVNAGGTSVTFYIDGSLVATNSTNIPTSNNIGPAFKMRKEVHAATTVASYLDYCYLKYDLTTSRGT